MLNYADDIPIESALAAHRGSSFVPETRAVQTRDGYAETLTSDLADLTALATTPEAVELLQTEFARYREGYKRHTLAFLAAQSRTVSPMIVGPARFPVQQMERRGETTHRRLTELLEFRNRAIKAIRRKLCHGLSPIMSGDSDAVERLEAKIAEAERLQAAMKRANAIIRAKPRYVITTEKIDEIRTLGFCDTTVDEIIGHNCDKTVGFPHFRFSNNNANIRRMRQRLEVIRRNKQAVPTQSQGETARLEDCPADNRVRLFFPGKPDAAVRNRLKSAGFRWTPSLGCWQAYRNTRSHEAAKTIAGV